MKTLKLRIMTTLLLGGLLSSGPVQATTFAALTLAQQAKKADVIVQATIGIPTTVTEGSQVYAVYPLKVSETLAGDAATLPQTVGSQSGGGPALFVLSGVETAPVFQAGQEVVLLLYKGRLDSPLVGYNQGAYLISNGQVSVLNAPLVSMQGPGVSARQPVTPILTTPLPAPQPVASVPTGTISQPPGPPAAPAAVGVAGTPLVNPASVPSVIAAPSAPAAGSPTAASGSLARVPPVPLLTTAPPSEAPVVPAASAASGTPAVGAPSAPSSAAADPMQGQRVAAPADTAAPLPIVAAPVGVRGTIRTPAELKAAIVAARASK